MAVVDDYLEVRPEAEDRLRALAAAGRISMGPWYILMDEFLASGETIIRNLQMGLARGAAFGGAMAVGYLPDMFGHIAQMPQILTPGRLRPTPWCGGACPRPSPGPASAGRHPTARRCGPSTFRTATATGPPSPTTPRRWCERTADHVERSGSSLLGDLLCMNGSDHLMPQAVPGPGGGRGQRPAGRLRLRGHLPARVSGRRAPTEGLEQWTGRAPVGLPGQHADGRHLQPGRREAPGRAGRAASWSAGPSPWPPCSSRRRPGPSASSTWPGRRWCATRPTTPSAPARSTTWSTPSCTATPRPAPSPPGWPTGPSSRWPGRWPNRAPTCSTRPTAPVPGWSSWWSVRTSRPEPDVQVLSEDAKPPAPWCSMRDTVRTILGHAPGPPDRARRLAPGHRRSRRTTTGISILFVGRARGAAQRPHRPGQAGHLRPHGRPARRHGPLRPRPAAPIRRIVARVARCRATAGSRSNRRRRPTRSTASDRGDRSRCPTAWSRSSRPGDRHLLAQRRARLRPAGRRRGPGRLLQLLPSDRGQLRRHARRGERRGPRVRARCGPRWPSPPPTSGPTTSTGARRPGWGHSPPRSRRPSSSGPTSRRCGSPPPSSTRAGTTACGSISPCPTRPKRSQAECAFTVVERGLTAEGRPDEFGPAHRAGPALRLGRGPDRGPRRGVRVRADRHRPPAPTGAAPRRWPSPCCARPACCPGPAWPTGPFRPARTTPVEGLQMAGRRITLATPWRSTSTTPTPWPTTSSSPSRW